MCLFLFRRSWVRLGPLGTPATNWATVPAPDDRWWVCSSRWNENWQGKPKYSEKTCHTATFLPWISHDMTWDRTRADTMGSWQLTAWAMERPFILLMLKTLAAVCPSVHNSASIFMSSIPKMSCKHGNDSGFFGHPVDRGLLCMLILVNTQRLPWDKCNGSSHTGRHEEYCLLGCDAV
jgi:hypothetical protein